MSAARSELVDLDVTPYYHCISRCVRRALLCGKGYEYRKAWIESRLEELASIFAVSVCSYCVMDNHLHVVVRLEGPDMLDRWSDEEVARRWGRLYPPRDKRRRPLPITNSWIKEKLQNTTWVATARQRLASLGWFMKCLKEPLARMANREEQCHGAFWEGRYKSIAILDTEALLATCAYVDLNPFAAGIVRVPEQSNHTSIKTRVQYCHERGLLKNLQHSLVRVSEGCTLAPRQAYELESRVWLCPFADATGEEANVDRLGMLGGFSLAQYLQLVDWTSRLAREGKAQVSTQVESILHRLGTTAVTWAETLGRLFSRDRISGVTFSFSRDRLRRAAAQRGRRHLANLCGCQA